MGVVPCLNRCAHFRSIPQHAVRRRREESLRSCCVASPAWGRAAFDVIPWEPIVTGHVETSLVGCIHSTTSQVCMVAVEDIDGAYCPDDRATVNNRRLETCPHVDVLWLYPCMPMAASVVHTSLLSLCLYKGIAALLPTSSSSLQSVKVLDQSCACSTMCLETHDNGCKHPSSHIPETACNSTCAKTHKELSMSRMHLSRSQLSQTTVHNVMLCYYTK